MEGYILQWMDKALVKMKMSEDDLYSILTHRTQPDNDQSNRHEYDEQPFLTLLMYNLALLDTTNVQPSPS